MDERGFLDGPAAGAQGNNPDAPIDEEIEAFSAATNAAADSPAESADDTLDSDLANLLAELDTAEDDGDWMAEIQQGDPGTRLRWITRVSGGL